MTNIRWYVIPVGDAEPLISPISGAPYVFGASCKRDALDYCAVHFSWRPVLPMSVCEYEALQEMKSAAKRFLDSCDRDRAIAIIRSLEEEALPKEQLLLLNAAVLLERVA